MPFDKASSLPRYTDPNLPIPHQPRPLYSLSLTLSPPAASASASCPPPPDLLQPLEPSSANTVSPHTSTHPTPKERQASSSLPARLSQGDRSRFGPLAVDWVDFSSSSPPSSSPTVSSTGRSRASFLMGHASPSIETILAASSDDPPAEVDPRLAFSILKHPNDFVTSLSPPRPVLPLPATKKFGSTTLPHGSIHLYRHVAPPSTTAAPSSSDPFPSLSSSHALTSSSSKSSSTFTTASVQLSSADSSASSSSTTASSPEDGLLVCILAVPSSLTPADFLSFVGRAESSMSNLRMIRDQNESRSVVLIKFRDEPSADGFVQAFNGRRFNEKDPEKCHVVKILSVFTHFSHSEPTSPPSGPTPTSFTSSSETRQHLSISPKHASYARIASAPSIRTAAFPALTSTNSSAFATLSTPAPIPKSPPRKGSKAIAPGPVKQEEGKDVALRGAYELPTCPVCLERLDSTVSGLITVPCDHQFHCECLIKWGDSRCPVCRYSQTPHASSNAPSPSVPDPPSICSSPGCTVTDNLWICLICGLVGCGRYSTGKHAQQHYLATSHLYSLEIATSRVWNYASDEWVHRLIQNQTTGGKLIELEPSSSTSSAPYPSAHPQHPSIGITSKKLESISLEYSHLLSSQLSAQRAFFEAQQSGLLARLAEAEISLALALSERDEAAKLESDRASSRKEAATASALEGLRERLRVVEREVGVEKAMNKGLLERLRVREGEMKVMREERERERAEWERKMRETEEEVRDLMFFLESREKIEVEGGMLEEGRGGDLLVVTGKGDEVDSVVAGSRVEKKKGEKKKKR